MDAATRRDAAVKLAAAVVLAAIWCVWPEFGALLAGSLSAGAVVGVRR